MNVLTDTTLGNRQYSFAVISDTHLNEAEDECSSPFDVNRRANARMRHVVHDLNQRDVAFVVNVGDLIHPVPALPDRYAEAANLFKAQVRELRHKLYLVPGNHDIGDKPNNWAPAAGICEDYLKLWDEHFGSDFYAFDHGSDRFIVLNAQLILSGLEREKRQKDWLENELAASEGKRLFLFTHYPPYFSNPDEEENYDNIGEPGRSWMLGLLEKYSVEALFAGHVHNFWFNKYVNTDCYLLPSTAFVRQDYSEMYRVRPGPDDEAGRNDRPKLGYAIIHVHENGHTIEFVRTFGAEIGEDGKPPRETPILPVPLHPRTNRFSSFGFDMRQNWMEMVEIPPSGGLDEFDRKEVRNDYPLMALWEMGIRKLRVPMRDLFLPENRERMRMLRAHGHEFTLFSFGDPKPSERKLIVENQDIFSAWEIAVNWDVLEDMISGIGEIARQVETPVYLSRLRSIEELRAEAGRYYHVINQGFLESDHAQMAELLKRPELENAIDGFVFRLTADRTPWRAIASISNIATAMGVNASVHLRMCGANPADAMEDDEWVAKRLIEAIAGAEKHHNIAVYADTFVDNDRGYFVRNGVLDRLCNPRLGFHVVQNLIGALNAFSEDFESDLIVTDSGDLCFALSGEKEKWTLVLADHEEMDVQSLCETFGESEIIDLRTGLNVSPLNQ